MRIVQIEHIDAVRNLDKILAVPGIDSICIGPADLSASMNKFCKFEDPEVGFKLAFIGSVKDEILDSQEIAVRLLLVMQKNYPERLEERYKITDFADLEPYELLELIGAKRGMKISGGDIDTERAAAMLLDEFRGGKIGRITLERPNELI